MAALWSSKELLGNIGTCHIGFFVFWFKSNVFHKCFNSMSLREYIDAVCEFGTEAALAIVDP